MRARHHLRGLELSDGLMKELLDKIAVPSNTEDHDVQCPCLTNRQQPKVQVEPTYTIVELPKPGQDPE